MLRHVIKSAPLTGRGQRTVLVNTCQVELIINYLYKPSDKPSLQIISQIQLLASFECVSVRTQPTFNLFNYKRVTVYTNNISIAIYMFHCLMLSSISFFTGIA